MLESVGAGVGSSMSEMTTVTVSILDKEYQVSCPPDEVDALTLTAR